MESPNPPGLLTPAAVFGNYTIVRHLGSGGMGAVYEATHRQLGKRVAIKTLLANYASNPTAQTRFLREGKLAAKLHHPHVVDVADFGIHDGIPYLVLELLEGEDLAALLERSGPMTPQQIADIMVPVTAAVASAHDAKIVHRDLKPGNIFLTRTGAGELWPKVLDFGISKLLTDVDGAQLTATLNLLGTPEYMSPEHARSAKHVDDRSDQYSLAVIVYECATDQMPFAADQVFDLVEQIRRGQFLRPRERVPDLPPEFEAVILRGMATRPSDRFATTWEFGSALLPFASLRYQLVWEAEFRGKASTFGGHATQRTASSGEIRALVRARLAEEPEEPSADLPEAPAEVDFQTRLDLPNPLARPDDDPRSEPSEELDSHGSADPPTSRDLQVFQPPVRRSPVAQARGSRSQRAVPPERVAEPTPVLAGPDDLELAGLASGWTLGKVSLGVAAALGLAALGWLAARPSVPSSARHAEPATEVPPSSGQAAPSPSAGR